MRAAEELQQRAAKLLSGSGWAHVGAVSKRNRPDRTRRDEWDATKFGAARENHAGNHGDADSGLDEAEHRVHLASLDALYGANILTTC